MRVALPGIDPAYYPKIVERYRYHYLKRDSQLILFDGVREMLTDLSERGFTMAVATGKSRAGLNRAFRDSQLGPLFHSSRCADETFSKPHPAMLMELTDELGHDMHRTVMIGDTTHDLQMAVNAGASGVAVHYGAHSPDSLKVLNPMYAANSVEELHAWLIENA